MIVNELTGIEILQKVIDEYNQLKFEIEILESLKEDHSFCKYKETSLYKEIEQLKEENKKLRYTISVAESRIRYLTDALANLNKDDDLL